MGILLTMVATGIGAALFAASGRASAQADYWYFGATLGSSNANLNQQMVAVAGATSSEFVSDQREPGYKLFLGYRFNPYFAVEGGYAGLGQFQAQNFVAAPTAGVLTAQIRVIGLYFDAVGMLPVGERFAFFGKVGWLGSETRTTLSTSGTVTPAGPVTHSSSDQANLSYGLGLQYEFAKNVTARVVWERYIKVGDEHTGEFNIDLFSGGLLFRF
jgi:OOP family OmpA-OmpF porin